MTDFKSCTKNKSHTKILVKQNQRVACFENPNKQVYAVTQFDGCVKCEGRKADYVIADNMNRYVIIELKGRHIEESKYQIVNTLKYVKSNCICNDKPYALVVCSKVPLGVSSVQRLTAELKAAGIGRIKVKSHEWRGSINDLF